MQISILAIIFIELFLMICRTDCVTASSRSDPDTFTVVKTNEILSGNIRNFVDYLSDGFHKAHFILTKSTTVQQRRTDSFRVENLADGSTNTELKGKNSLINIQIAEIHQQFYKCST
jgi:hypothetical protein